MAKVIGVVEKTYQKDGQTKKLWNLMLTKADGTDIGVTTFEPVQKGDEIDEARIEKDGKGGWIIKSKGGGGYGGKGGYQKDSEAIMAQVAFKGMIDLLVAGKLEFADINATTCLNLAKIIQTATNALKQDKPVETHAEPVKTATASPAPQIDTAEVLACDWSTFEKKDFDQALAGMARAKKLSPESAKAFLVDQFGIESSSMIPIAKRNEVLRIMSGLS